MRYAEVKVGGEYAASRNKRGARYSGRGSIVKVLRAVEFEVRAGSTWGTSRKRLVKGFEVELLLGETWGIGGDPGDKFNVEARVLWHEETLAERQTGNSEAQRFAEERQAAREDVESRVAQLAELVEGLTGVEDAVAVIAPRYSGTVPTKVAVDVDVFDKLVAKAAA